MLEVHTTQALVLRHVTLVQLLLVTLVHQPVTLVHQPVTLVHQLVTLVHQLVTLVKLLLVTLVQLLLVTQLQPLVEGLALIYSKKVPGETRGLFTLLF